MHWRLVGRCRIDLLLAVLQWRNVVAFLENAAEMRIVFKPAVEGDIADGFFGRTQQLPRMQQPFLHQPAMRRHIVSSLEIPFERRKAAAA
jgi:hypothetical protein